MLILSLETATRVAGAALCEDDQVLGEVVLNSGAPQSQQLMPAVQCLFSTLKQRPTSVAAIAVSCGPGSFTGLRIGLATAKALALAVEGVLIGVPTLEVLAANLAQVQGVICPLLPSRRGEVYTAAYRWREETLERLGDYQVLAASEFIGWLEGVAGNEGVWLVGEGLATLANAGVVLSQAGRVVGGVSSLPRAAVVGQLGYQLLMKGHRDSIIDLAPLYLRPSAAEVKAGCAFSG